MAGVRATKSGFAREAQDKINSKYDEQLAEQCMSWINERVQTIGEPSFNTSGKLENVHKELKDGIVLCSLMSSLHCPTKAKKKSMPFVQMENISNFLRAAENYGLPKSELFQTVDLFEAQNLSQVIMTIAALARKAQSKGEKGFGPKESEAKTREWTEEQLKAGQNVIGLQMGSNKGATQAGQNFGKSRMITD